MTIGGLMAMFDQFSQEKEIVIEIKKPDGKTTSTYDVGFERNEFDELVLTVCE